MPDLKGTAITWLGHATVLITTPKGTNILIDPFITGNPKYPEGFELPAKLPYILLTHGHGDHISDAAPLAKKYGSKVIAIYELANYVQSQGAAETIGINIGGTVQLDVANALPAGTALSFAASAGSGKTRRLTDRLVRLMPPAAGTFLQIAAQGPIFAG